MEEGAVKYYSSLSRAYGLASGGATPDLGQDLELRLETLTDIAELLQIDDLKPSSYLAAISDRSAKELYLTRLALQLDRAEEELREHLAEAEYEEKLIQKWTDVITAQPDSQQDIERRVQDLATKARECQRELDDVMARITETPSPSVSEVVALQEAIRDKERELKAKRAKVESYQGLPPNIELARHELQKAQEEQMKLFQLRERLLANMVEGVA